MYTERWPDRRFIQYMQVVVKTSDTSTKDASPLIRNLVLNAVPALNEAVGVFVSKVFPTATTGNRSRMYTIKLPDDIAAPVVGKLVDELAKNEKLEYAQLSSPKKPLSI
jgi:hypothetical protein